jgi:CBS domain-containing protein
MTRTSRHVPFTAVMRLARDKDPSLSAVADRIELFNQLRNVIVHNGTDLAQPVLNTVKAIEAIRDMLEAPALLTPAFLRQTAICKPDDRVRTVAKLMATEDFSQLPVYDDRGLLKGIITTAAIARWLGTHADGEMAQLDTPVHAVMKYEEYPKAFAVFSVTDTVGKALAAFKKSSDRGEPLYAIVLTEDGRHDSTPKGVITLFDMPQLWSTALGD